MFFPFLWGTAGEGGYPPLFGLKHSQQYPDISAYLIHFELASLPDAFILPKTPELEWVRLRHGKQ